jgi:phosphoenolpyruvate synthase/pyruvate phosphate dikinase
LSVSPVLGFEDKDCENPDEAGGKGAGLAKMTRLGMPVPPGFVVRASVLAGLLDATGLRESVLSHLEGAADGAAESSRASRSCSFQLISRRLSSPPLTT